MTPRVGDILLAELAQAEEEIIEPESTQQLAEAEPAPLPEEPAPESPLPEVSVFVIDEPGLTELAPAPILSSSSNLKVMGIILIVFSFLAMVFFVFQVFQGNLSRLVLLVPILGMLIGFVSVLVAQKR
jgi:hypothetical protein